MNQEKEVLNTIKQRGKKMIKQLQEFSDKTILVNQFDEEDWRELMALEFWEAFEPDKASQRVE